MIAVGLTLTVWLLLATADAHPHHQLYYNPGFQAQQAPNSYYYAPQADAANVVSIQRFASPVPVGLPPAAPLPQGRPQYVLLYPGDPQHNFIHRRVDVEPRKAEGEPEDANRPTIWNLFNVFQRPPFATTPPTVEAATTVESSTSRIATSTAVTTVEETTPKSVEEASVKPEKIVTDKGEIMLAVEQAAAGTTDEEKASLENLDETLPQNPQVGGTAPDGRQFTLIQRPQFFGNYDFLSQSNMQQRFGIPPGAVSDFLLFRNGFVQPGAVPQPTQPGRPLKIEQDNYIPGSAALAFQQELQSAQRKEQEGTDGPENVDATNEADGLPTKPAQIPGSEHVDVSQIYRQGIQPHVFIAPNPAAEFVGAQSYPVGGHGLVSLRHTVLPNQQVFTSFQQHVAPPGVVNVGPGYQNVFLVSPRQFEASQSVVVEADAPRKDDKGDTENVEAEQAGPSVAQAKPQAIALAGVGGVASASPVATAVVGPGGLAVSAPSATAVAGPSGGGTLVGPAQAAISSVNKHITSGKVKTKSRDESYDDSQDEDRFNVQ